MGGGSVLVRAGISYHSRIDLHFFNGPVNALAYRDQVFAPVALPYLRRTPGVTTLQHYNARAHIARLCTAFLQSNNVMHMDLPALYPDMAPIEHVWDECRLPNKTNPV